MQRNVLTLQIHDLGQLAVSIACLLPSSASCVSFLPSSASVSLSTSNSKLMSISVGVFQSVILCLSVLSFCVVWLYWASSNDQALKGLRLQWLVTHELIILVWTSKSICLAQFWGQKKGKKWNGRLGNSTSASRNILVYHMYQDWLQSIWAPVLVAYIYSWVSIEYGLYQQWWSCWLLLFGCDMLVRRRAP